MGYQMSAACGCNIGRQRSNNEDNFYFDGSFLPVDNHALQQILTRVFDSKEMVDMCIFDGMGGHADGQIASALAAETFDQFRKERVTVEEPFEFMKNAVERMTDEVWHCADETFTNMGTTAAMLRLYEDSFYACNVGDSRIYVCRDEGLTRISHDHTDEDFLKERGIAFHRKPNLTQYIGVSPEELVIEPYIVKGEIEIGDQFLICSDGLTDMVPENEICRILKIDGTPEEKTDMLIQTALSNGGKDNITVIILQVMNTLLCY